MVVLFFLLICFISFLELNLYGPIVKAMVGAITYPFGYRSCYLGSLIPAVPSQVQFYVMYFGSLQQYITLQVLGINKLCLILFVCDHRFLPTIVIYISYAYIGEFYYHFSPTYVKKKLVIQIH